MTDKEFIEILNNIDTKPDRCALIKQALLTNNIDQSQFTYNELCVIIRFGQLDYNTKSALIDKINNNSTLQLLANWRYDHLVTKEYPWLPSKFTSHVRKARIAANFKANSKNIKLDMFSFKVFKKHLEDSKKKLPSTDVIRYLKELLDGFTSDERNINIMYKNLLWEHSTKSETLAKYLSDTGRYREATTVQNIVSTLYDGNTYTPETILVLNNWEFSKLAAKILLPTPSHYNANTHQTVTGIVKKPASNQIYNDLVYKVLLIDAYIKTYPLQPNEKEILQAHKQTLIDSLKLGDQTGFIETSKQNYTAMLQSLQSLEKELNE